jgi:hypothetical protein
VGKVARCHTGKGQGRPELYSAVMRMPCKWRQGAPMSLREQPLDRPKYPVRRCSVWIAERQVARLRQEALTPVTVPIQEPGSPSLQSSTETLGEGVDERDVSDLCT